MITVGCIPGIGELNRKRENLSVAHGSSRLARSVRIGDGWEMRLDQNRTRNLLNAQAARIALGIKEAENKEKEKNSFTSQLFLNLKSGVNSKLTK